MKKRFNVIAMRGAAAAAENHATSRCAESDRQARENHPYEYSQNA